MDSLAKLSTPYRIFLKNIGSWGSGACGDVDEILDAFEKEYIFFSENGLKTDSNFDTELMKGNFDSFSSKIWEIALGNKFVRHGFNISSPKEGPDFRIQFPDGKVAWVEAVCAFPGTGNDRVKSFNELPEPESLTFPSDQVTFRWQNAIDNKIKKYEDYYKTIIKPDDYFLIAVNGINITRFSADFLASSQMPYIVEIAYGSGPLTVDIYSKSKRKSDWYLQSSPVLYKANGGPVEKTLFLDNKHSFISGIIGTCETEMDLMTKGAQIISLVHNPYAVSKMGKSQLPMHTEYELHVIEDNYKIKSFVTTDTSKS